VGRATVATANGSGAAVLGSIEEAIAGALAHGQVARETISAAGVGVPGQVDTGLGLVLLAVNLNLDDFPLGQKLAHRLGGVPVRLENDVRLAAMGLYDYLKREEPIRHLAYVSVGTGIAAGLILDGALHRGAGGMAGEIGHIVVDPGGAPCPCGLHGCLETIVSGPAIARQAAATPALTRDLGPQPEPAAVYQAAQEGHVQAAQLVQHVSGHLARAIHWLAMTYDVERIILGGGVAAAGDAFWSPIAAELQQLRRMSALAQKMLPEERVTTLCHMRDTPGRDVPRQFNPGVWGALALADQP
jgi:glucokinase